MFSSAIFIIRNPFHALVAEWNCLMTLNHGDNHILSIGDNYFSEYVSTAVGMLLLYEYVSLLVVCEVE